MSAIFSDPRSLEPPADLSGRPALRDAFLRGAGLAQAQVTPLAGDASTRAYSRLLRPGRPPLILMDAPPAAESAPAPPDASDDERIAKGYNALARLAGGRLDAFAGAAQWLREQGLSAPELHALDVMQGFAVLEDLGDDLFVRRIAAGEAPEPIYAEAVDLLIALHARPVPALLPFAVGDETGGWALPTYDALALKLGADLFLDWQPKLMGLSRIPDDALAEWSALWAPIQAAGERGAEVFVHRDFHAENLLWLPEREGAARVGLLDFQDAVKGHRTWDLLHLLQDARRDVAPELERAMLDRYLAAHPDIDREAFLADYAGLGALNAARILGPVFARQVVVFGREKYRAFMPRTWRNLERNLEHPSLAGLKAWFDRWMPAEARA